MAKQIIRSIRKGSAHTSCEGGVLCKNWPADSSWAGGKEKRTDRIYR